MSWLWASRSPMIPSHPSSISPSDTEPHQEKWYTLDQKRNPYPSGKQKFPRKTLTQRTSASSKSTVTLRKSSLFRTNQVETCPTSSYQSFRYVPNRFVSDNCLPQRIHPSHTSNIKFFTHAILIPLPDKKSSKTCTFKVSIQRTINTYHHKNPHTTKRHNPYVSPI